jgi:hypothetical protein
LPETKRCGFTLKRATRQRLVIYAEMTGQTPLQVVEGLINEHCKRWVVSDRDPESEAA